MTVRSSWPVCQGTEGEPEATAAHCQPVVHCLWSSYTPHRQIGIVEGETSERATVTCIGRDITKYKDIVTETGSGSGSVVP